MLSIRMQRRGRKGHSTYRVVVQESRKSPTSGKIVAHLGNYDPHAKTANLVKDKAEFYLKNGAQPSERVVKLFTSEGVSLPSWANKPSEHKRTTRNPEKLRKNRPAEEVKAEEPAPAEEPKAEETDEPKAEAVTEAKAEASEPAQEQEKAEEPATEEPAK